MSGEAMSEDAFAFSRRLWSRWLQNLSLAADASLRSQLFLLWMRYGIRSLIEARRLQNWWFPRSPEL